MSIEETAQSGSSYASSPGQFFGVESEPLGLAVDLVAVFVGEAH